MTAGTAPATELTFGAYASDKPSDMVIQLRPILTAIERELSVTMKQPTAIRLKVVNGYEDGTDLIVQGEVDIMRLGAASYVKAKRENPKLSILAMESMRGKNEFYGIVAVHRDSDIKTLQDLRGRTFAFGAETSTLGRYVPQYQLAKSGIFARDLSRFEYLGRHDAVGAAVGAGLFDAGALEETMFAKLVARGTPIRELSRFPNATKPWVARAGLDNAVVTGLRAALLRVKDSEALASLRFDGFMPGVDSDFEATRQAVAENELFFSKASSPSAR
ncbi:MAG TPA: PhnD/SsuA/transferrin family substrate-binding protein [Alphaproteobacteria bacterium]|nr:PhnD/SsuA/transferrin family substrate-binding protein [Alphaproteobacteria bacterium]